MSPTFSIEAIDKAIDYGFRFIQFGPASSVYHLRFLVFHSHIGVATIHTNFSLLGAFDFPIKFYLHHH